MWKGHGVVILPAEVLPDLEHAADLPHYWLESSVTKA